MAINPGYFVREAFSSFRRNWVMSLVAVITIYLSLLLVGVFVVSGMLVNKIVTLRRGEGATSPIFLKDGAASADVDGAAEGRPGGHRPCHGRRRTSARSRRSSASRSR